METLNELASSIKQAAVERLGSPLIGSFILAWCAWNYRFLVILLSHNGALATFNLIDRLAFPDAASIVWRGIVAPLLSAVIYVFAYPPLANEIYGYLLQMKLQANALKKKIEGAELLTKQEADNLRVEHGRYAEKAESTISRLEQSLQDATSRGERHRKEYLQIAERTADSENGLVASLTEEKKLILRLLDQVGGAATMRDLRAKSELPASDFNRYVKDLAVLELVDEEPRSSSSGEDRVKIIGLGSRVLATMAKMRGQEIASSLKG